MYDKNKFDQDVSRNRGLFLKKYLVDYTNNKKYYNVNTKTPIDDYPFLYEQLFRLNFLVANGDGFIVAIPAICNR